MEYVTLGKTGLKISRLGFGGIPIQRIDANAAKELIRELMGSGVNYIDTARAYTVSEAFLGKTLEGIRDRFIVATKTRTSTKEAMEADIQASLLNLRTDYIDLYQIHNPSMQALLEAMESGGSLEALEEARTAGKIRHIGITTHSVEVFEKALALPWVETIMFPYNIVETQGDALISRCQKEDIGFICMKPLAGGAIENPELALRFICANPAVSVVIPGMYQLKEVKQNCSIVNGLSPLTEEEKEKIKEIRKELGNNFCRRCNYCAPCTEGISIADVFLFDGYLKRYGLRDWATERYQSLSVKADACIECGECESRCPYELPIRKMLKQCADDFRG